MFRALYKSERGKKRVSGWVKDQQQIADTPYPGVLGCYYSSVVRDETQIPNTDEWLIDDNGFLVSLTTVPTTASLSQVETVVIENNVTKLKQIFRDIILDRVPLESQLTGLMSGSDKFLSQQLWVKSKLILLRQAIKEMRDGKRDAFTIRNNYVRDLENSSPPESVSILDLVDEDAYKIPITRKMDIYISDSVSVGSGTITSLVLQKSDNTTTSQTITNRVLQNTLKNPLVRYLVDGNPLLDNELLPQNFDCGGNLGTLMVEFDTPQRLESILLNCEDSSSSIYLSIDSGPNKYIKLNELHRHDGDIKTLKFSIPKRIKKIGPLQLGICESQVADLPFQVSVNLPPNSLVSLTRDEGVEFSLFKEGSCFIPIEVDGKYTTKPIKGSVKLGDFVYGSKHDNSLVFPVHDECELLIHFTDDHYRSVDLTIEKTGERFTYETINNWSQIGSTIFLPQKMTGTLLISKI